MHGRRNDWLKAKIQQNNAIGIGLWPALRVSQERAVKWTIDCEICKVTLPNSYEKVWSQEVIEIAYWRIPVEITMITITPTPNVGKIYL